MAATVGLKKAGPAGIAVVYRNNACHPVEAYGVGSRNLDRLYSIPLGCRQIHPDC